MTSLFSSPKVPQITTPPPTPVVDDAAITQAKTQQLQLLAGRSGRASTILSDKLGN